MDRSVATRRFNVRRPAAHRRVGRRRSAAVSAPDARRNLGRRDARKRGVRCGPMNIHLSLTPLISLIAGILILIMPKLLNFIVAIYLIAIGLIGIFGVGAMRLH